MGEMLRPRHFEMSNSAKIYGKSDGSRHVKVAPTVACVMQLHSSLSEGLSARIVVTLTST